MANKLELTWYGKENEIKVEPRILIENPELSSKKADIKGQATLFDLDKKEIFDNMLIHGDNLLALKALEKEYAGKIKCIYIDPPYNTGAAFEYYDDNVEHSTWLNLMYARLQILRNLLSDDGTIFIQIDDNEQAYLKVLCDEIFGRSNFVNMLSVKAKASSGASGGGEDKRLKKNIEYILIYSKSDKFDSFKTVYQKTLLKKYIEERKDSGKNFAYTSVLINPGVESFYKTVQAGNGEPIDIYKVSDYEIKSVSQIMKEEKITQEEVYNKYIDKIFTLENAQTSIRGRVAEVTTEDDGYFLAKYIPVSGRNKGQKYSVGFVGKTKRLMSFLSNLVVKENEQLYKRDKVGTLWDDLSWSAVSLEGSVPFPSGKKPEALLERIIYMASDEGDYILDSFLGSGSTIATAHKMKRRWIGIEMGEHAYTHCKVRMDNIISGLDNTGISRQYSWNGGGGYKFYELAPTLIKEDAFGQEIINPEYNAEMLASAIAKHEGYTYQPDETVFWKQSRNGKSFLFVTTNHVNSQMIETIKADLQEDEFVLIVCKSFESGCNYEKNIAIKKIPQSLLKNCEFGRDDYSLNIICPPEYEEDCDE